MGSPPGGVPFAGVTILVNITGAGVDICSDRNQGDRIEIFGLGETKYERKWIYLERRPRTWAHKGRALRGK